METKQGLLNVHQLMPSNRDRELIDNRMELTLTVLLVLRDRLLKA
jgi:hypothetical protein